MQPFTSNTVTNSSQDTHYSEVLAPPLKKGRKDTSVPTLLNRIGSVFQDYATFRTPYTIQNAIIQYFFELRKVEVNTVEEDELVKQTCNFVFQKIKEAHKTDCPKGFSSFQAHYHSYYCNPLTSLYPNLNSFEIYYFKEAYSKSLRLFSRILNDGIRHFKTLDELETATIAVGYHIGYLTNGNFFFAEDDLNKYIQGIYKQILFQVFNIRPLLKRVEINQLFERLPEELECYKNPIFAWRMLSNHSFHHGNVVEQAIKRTIAINQAFATFRDIPEDMIPVMHHALDSYRHSIESIIATVPAEEGKIVHLERLLDLLPN